MLSEIIKTNYNYLQTFGSNPPEYNIILGSVNFLITIVFYCIGL
jgi:hypothetical protein